MKNYKYLFLFILIVGCIKTPSNTAHLPVESTTAMDEIIDLLVARTAGGKTKVAVLDFNVIENEKRKSIDGIIEIKNSGIKIVSMKTHEQGEMNHNLQKKAEMLNADYYLTGSYWSVDDGRSGIDIKLYNTANGTLLTSGRIIAHQKDNLNFQPVLVSQPKSHKLEIDFYLDKTEHVIGDELTLNFKSDTDCYLYLVNVADNGEYTILLPNGSSKANFFKAGQQYRIPEENSNFAIKAQAPAGTNKIMAIAVATGDNKPVWVQQYVESRIYKDKSRRGDQKKKPDEKTDIPQEPKDMLAVLGHHLNDLFKGLNRL